MTIDLEIPAEKIRTEEHVGGGQENMVREWKVSVKEGQGLSGRRNVMGHAGR